VNVASDSSELGAGTNDEEATGEESTGDE